MRKTLLLLIVPVLVLGVAACGSDSSDTKASGSTSSSTAVSNTPTLTGKVNDKGTEDARTLDSLEVEADDFYFEPTYVETAPGQAITIELHNEGDATHTFTVDSLGIDDQLAPGAEKDVSVTLPEIEGVVEFHCTFHASMGMRGAFVVGGGGAGAGAGAGSSSTTSTTQTSGGGGGYGY